MGLKSPSTAYYENKMLITGRAELLHEWLNAPITKRDRELLCDLLDRMTIKELSAKYFITESGVTKWKTRLFAQLHRYDMRMIKY